MPTKKQYRQGDVLVERVGKPSTSIIIREAEARESGRVILAHGEVTGHAHAITAPQVKKSKYRREVAQDAPIEVSDLEVEQAIALLEHEEHSTIPLEKGSYRVTRQREYSPQAIRNVAD